MTVLARRDDGLEIDDDPARVDVDRTFELVVGQGYWASDRSREAVAAAIPASWCFAVYDGERQVAFARAVTDRVTFAWVCDVIVDEPYRGRGIGHWLMTTVTEALEAAGVRRQILATADAHEVYASVGYRAMARPEWWMERDTRASMGGAASSEGADG
ncbi:MAG TPA: GNAT family N-acetyltransferase [Candidatus Nanopelagicales bacterium]|nr:GNAT family N-acetyltransferase [Candidatus Nanopelagicales bacterium]